MASQIRTARTRTAREDDDRDGRTDNDVLVMPSLDETDKAFIKKRLAEINELEQGNYAFEFYKGEMSSQDSTVNDSTELQLAVWSPSSSSNLDSPFSYCEHPIVHGFSRNPLANWCGGSDSTSRRPGVDSGAGMQMIADMMPSQFTLEPTMHP